MLQHTQRRLRGKESRGTLDFCCYCIKSCCRFVLDRRMMMILCMPCVVCISLPFFLFLLSCCPLQKFLVLLKCTQFIYMCCRWVLYIHIHFHHHPLLCVALTLFHSFSSNTLVSLFCILIMMRFLPTISFFSKGVVNKVKRKLTWRQNQSSCVCVLSRQSDWLSEWVFLSDGSLNCSSYSHFDRRDGCVQGAAVKIIMNIMVINIINSIFSW